MKRFGEGELLNVTSVIESGKLSPFYQSPLGGGWVQAFEKDFGEYHNSKNAIAVSSGTAALHISLLALGIGKGDEVIVPPLSFVATASAVLMAGAKPVFCDVDKETYNIDPKKIEKCITEKTKAIIPVHLLGNPCDMERIMKIAQDHGLFVIEDCAQSLGASINWKLVGTFGHMSIFSFQETKTITTLGEGGMILTYSPFFADKCRAIRNHAEKYFSSLFLGYNYRMTEAQAAFGLAQMNKLNHFNSIQKENAKYFLRKLPKGIKAQKVRDGCDSTYFIIGCTLEDDELLNNRDEIINRLVEKGIHKTQPGASVGKGYSELISDLPLFKKYKAEVPNAKKLLPKFLWFDIHRWKEPEKFKEDVEVVLEVLEEVRNK